ncbi:MAG: hypothetical protein QXF17_05310, partial [Ignisphaera sp.]
MSDPGISESLPTFYRAYLQIANFISNSLLILRRSQVEQFVEVLVKAYHESRKVLVMGAGRSGLVGR